MKKSEELVEKLQKEIGPTARKMIQSQICINDIQKHVNEEIYYNIDKVQRCIFAKKRLTFKYMEYNTDKEIVLRKDGKLYEVSPYALIWSNENYYLVCNIDILNTVTHFRLDRMKSVEILDKPERNFEEVTNYKDVFNVADYTNKHFSALKEYMDSADIEEIQEFPDYTVGDYIYTDYIQ